MAFHPRPDVKIGARRTSNGLFSSNTLRYIDGNITIATMMENGNHPQKLEKFQCPVKLYDVR